MFNHRGVSNLSAEMRLPCQLLMLAFEFRIYAKNEAKKTYIVFRIFLNTNESMFI